MPGFFTIIDNTKTTHKQFKQSGFHKSISVDTQLFSIDTYSDSIKKFENDKLFHNGAGHIIVLEGVVFNISELKEKYRKDSWLETVREMYSKNKDTFYIEFRGSYSGYIYDKSKNIWTLFTNPIGDKQIFYYQDSEVILFGSEIKHFLSFFKQNNISYSLDINAAYMLLSYGYFIGNYTLFNEIRKLNAGHYIAIDNQKIRVNQYHQFSNEPNLSLSESDMIEGIDFYFRQAIKRQFEKDKEYKLRSLVALSGGLDARMTTWVAHEMGYHDMLNITFSQSGYLDQTIAQEIASDLNHEWLFKSLDGGVFLKEQIEKVVSVSYGGALYYGLAHGNSLLQLIDFKNIGLLHSGQLGDVVIGTFFRNKNDIKKAVNVNSGFYSNKLIFKISNKIDTSKYENTEIFNFYTRGFTGANQGLIASQQYSESFSPFYDFEFLSFCLSIPVEKRINHSIYKKWILEKYPKAANYIWETTGAKVSAKTVKILGKSLTYSQLQMALNHRISKYVLRKEVGASDTKHHMNPLDYWYRTNPDLKLFMDSYYKDNIQRLAVFPELRNDVINHYEKGNNIEKNQVLTLLAAMKLFFDNVYTLV